ncbi:MAG: beta-lactamase family protein [Lachnospiraceae bacterium]|nr:beta-lactamase family protein [Lachnospiraceae bacterium]
MDFTILKEFMDHLTAWRMPGNSIRVYLGQEEVFRYSSGYSNVEKQIPMNGTEHLFIYSCSKVATAAAALQLYEKGYFLLDDPLYDFLPEYREMYVKQPDGEIRKAQNPITIRQLFTHTSGLNYNTKSPAFEKAGKLTDGKMDTETVIRCLAEEPLAFEPGEKWTYGLSHDVLAVVIEKISGQKFRDYVKEHIFEPLGMHESFYHAEGVLDRMAEQYFFDEGGKASYVDLQSASTHQEGILVNKGKQNHLIFGTEYDSGGAGIVTTVGDYAKFTCAMANKGLGMTGERILSPGTIELMRQPQTLGRQQSTFTGSRKGYGYGLGVRTMINRAESGSNGSLYEFGWGGAAGANVLIDTELGLSAFYAHHMLNPFEEYYQPRLRNALYAGLKI